MTNYLKSFHVLFHLVLIKIINLKKLKKNNKLDIIGPFYRWENWDSGYKSVQGRINVYPGILKPVYFNPSCVKSVE